MHQHTHGHGHQPHSGSHRLFLMGVIATLAFAVAEAIGGYYAHSLALIGDAGHMASDGVALAIAAFAAWMIQRPASDKHSYGFGRAEIIAAWISSILLVMVSLWVIWEAILRLQHPQPVRGLSVLVIAAIGIVFNAGLAWLLSRNDGNLNARAAFLHVLGDLAATAATLVAGLLIYFTNLVWIDPILSILISILILNSSYRLLRESMSILMEGVPHHLNIEQVSQTMLTLEEVSAVHDVHIWTVSSKLTALSAHVDIYDLTTWDSALIKLKTLLHEQFHIDHITLQPEMITDTKKCEPCYVNRK